MNNKYKVLLVDDDVNIRTSVSTMLENGGYRVIIASTCHTAKTMFESYAPDLIILELSLPDCDGMEIISYVRQGFLTPIIVLSARADDGDKVSALDMGANDYVTKPFSEAELLARIRATLRNNRHSNIEGHLPGGKFVLEGLVIDYDARRIFVGEKEVRLTQNEYNIIAYLSEHCGKMMTYSSIIKAVWGSYVEDGSIKKLQVNIANIRKKLGIKPGEAKYIFNELGVGYRMDATC